MKSFYILSDYDRTVLYIDVTDDLTRRRSEHTVRMGSHFAAKYNVKYLISREEFPDANHAISREKQLKKWHRDRKLKLVHSVKGEMQDLSETIPGR